MAKPIDAAGVRLRHAGLAAGEEHHPAALRVAHHPGVAHRPVVPVAGRVLLVAVVDVEREAVADPRPVVQVGARSHARSAASARPRHGWCRCRTGARARRRPAPPSRSRWCSRPTPALRPARSVVPLCSQVFRSRLVAWPCVTLKCRRSGFAERLVGLQEEPVPEVAVADVPAVPDPLGRKCEGHVRQPFTPVEAIDEMNARCRTR